MTSPFGFTCDYCHGDYTATASNATAVVYFTDHRCNHIQARCTLCRRTEVIFLGPNKLEDVIRNGRIPVKAHAEPDGSMRLRAARAWKAADDAAEAMAARRQQKEQQVSEQRKSGGESTPEPEVKTYELTSRLEDEVNRFRQALEAMPDDLLAEGWGDDTDRPYPDRWID